MTGQRILVVEDNERNLKLIRDVLQFAGYRSSRPAPVKRASHWRRIANRIWS